MGSGNVTLYAAYRQVPYFNPNNWEIIQWPPGQVNGEWENYTTWQPTFMLETQAAPMHDPVRDL